MSNNAKCAPGSHENLTILSNVALNFGYKEDTNKTNTQEFLEASKVIVAFIEKLGKIFAPLKYDMNGNITKITTKYLENPTEYGFLEDMVLAEKTDGGIVTIDALQWLRRGLHFVAKFFDCVLTEADAGNEQQNLTPFFKQAYEEVLERYHGWMGAQLFNIMCRFAPNRKDMFLVITNGGAQNDKTVLKDMRIFKTNLMTCVQHLIEFYNLHNLESNNRV